MLIVTINLHFGNVNMTQKIVTVAGYCYNRGGEGGGGGAIIKWFILLNDTNSVFVK